MKEQELVLKEIFSERGMDSVRPHIVKNIVGERIQPLKPHVSAIGTSGGKTWMTAARFELLYRMGYLGKDDKVLILAADKDILRTNFIESFESFFENKKACFEWRAVKTKKEMEQAIQDGVQVFITIPQSLNRSKLELLSKQNFVWMVQDEAHKWYSARKVQKKILKYIKLKYQSLLTGTPFIFNDKANEYVIDYTTVREMYEAGFLSDVETQVLYTDVELTQLDYESLLGDLNSGKVFTDDETFTVLNEVVSELIKKVKVPFKGLQTTHNVTSNMASVFNKLQKTILFARGIDEAECIHGILQKNGVSSLITHSKRKESSTEVFGKFKENDDIKILVAVGQGREGFDFPNLYNVVDMTFTQSFSLAMQMFGRVLRKSDKINKKFYYKVAPKNMGGYFNDWMNGLFMMMDYEWYSVYNGKNALQLPLPKKLVNKMKKAAKTNGSVSKNIRPKNISYINSLSFMSKNKWFKLNGKVSTISATTLKEVVQQHKKADKMKRIEGMVSQFDNLSDLIKSSPNLYELLRKSEQWMGIGVYGKFSDYAELPNTIGEIKKWAKKNLNKSVSYEMGQVIRTKISHLLIIND